MRRIRPTRETLKGLLLGLLLVCAQSLAQAHEVVHDPAGEPELCATCSVGGGLKAAATATVEPTIPAPVAITPDVPAAPTQVSPIRRTPDARAPPLNP
jgi:hypothetical protein